jgi:outer membrane protein assembly factor BamE
MRLISIHILVTLIVLAGCSFSGVHKNPVIQGNQLIPERIERLEVGMSRDQVQFLLGSPITVNTFNPDRWIYLERVDFDGEVQQNTYLIVNFKSGQVSEIRRESGGSPSDPLSKIDTTPPDRPDGGPWWWPF